ncbi:MAG: hypothetical protein KDN22_28450 [Verrucomicrobiae bacterium]|nr:hypothetical protein [Verrucomicrobiae bacterium]
MSPSAMEDLVNGIEIFVWITIAVVIAGRAAIAARRDYWLPAFAFLAFGISNAVEMTTGAWWKPWWLLVWKVACLVVISRFFWLAYRQRPKK